MEHKSILFSGEGAEVVAGLARWMRIVSMIYFLGAGLFALAGLVALFIGESFALVPVVIFMTVALCLGFAGGCLGSSGAAFERGILSGDPTTLGRGFRHLRAFFLLFGTLGVLYLGSTLIPLVRLQ